MLARGAATTGPAIDRSARAIVTVAQAIVAAVSGLFLLLVRLARSTRAAVRRGVEVAWPSIAAGSAACAGLARASALRLAAAAARSGRRAAWAFDRTQKAVALSLSSAAVTFGRAVLRSIDAASDEISVLSTAGRQAAAESARRTLSNVQRLAAMTASSVSGMGSYASIRA